MATHQGLMNQSHKALGIQYDLFHLKSIIRINNFDIRYDLNTCIQFDTIIKTSCAHQIYLQKQQQLVLVWALLHEYPKHDPDRSILEYALPSLLSPDGINRC